MHIAECYALLLYPYVFWGVAEVDWEESWEESSSSSVFDLTGFTMQSSKTYRNWTCSF